MKGKKTKEQFVADAIKVHGGKYDYSKVKYNGCLTKVEIICPIHGSFFQTPTSHLSGKGCVKCYYEEYSKNHRKSTEQFIKEARLIHGDKYDYRKTEYKNKRSKVCITCPKHGDFWQNAQSHLNGCGCKECMKENFRITYSDFISRSKKIHGDKYDYSLITESNFKGASSYVDIICPIHGVFKQKAVNHFHGKGCPECSKLLLRRLKADTKNEFIRKAISIHGNKYDYSDVNYINQGTNVCIKCNKHGYFWQRPNHHLSGVGCPMCKHSLGEEKVLSFLKRNHIEFKPQYKLYNESLLCDNKYLFVDFYLPKHNIIIEFNGEQHYKPIEWFGGQERFEQQQERDMALKQYCHKYKIKLIEISYKDIDNIDKILNKITPSKL